MTSGESRSAILRGASARRRRTHRTHRAGLGLALLGLAAVTVVEPSIRTAEAAAMPRSGASRGVSPGAMFEGPSAARARIIHGRVQSAIWWEAWGLPWVEGRSVMLTDAGPDASVPGDEDQLGGLEQWPVEVHLGQDDPADYPGDDPGDDPASLTLPNETLIALGTLHVAADHKVLRQDLGSEWPDEPDPHASGEIEIRLVAGLLEGWRPGAVPVVAVLARLHPTTSGDGGADDGRSASVDLLVVVERPATLEDACAWIAPPQGPDFEPAAIGLSGRGLSDIFGSEEREPPSVLPRVPPSAGPCAFAAPDVPPLSDRCCVLVRAHQLCMTACWYGGVLARDDCMRDQISWLIGAGLGGACGVVCLSGLALPFCIACLAALGLIVWMYWRSCNKKGDRTRRKCELDCRRQSLLLMEESDCPMQIWP